MRQRRIRLCRLAPEDALSTFEDACAFLADRGMLTLTADSALPSLFAACHEPPYKPGGTGFASWPRTKWPWGGRLAEQEGVVDAKVHRGKTLLLSAEAATLVDPICRAELDRVEAGSYGPEGARLVAYLSAAGPRRSEECAAELGLTAAALRSVRTKLERVGAVVARSIEVEGADFGHRHTSVLRRWDQQKVKRSKRIEADALRDLVVAGVRAAVLAPENEARAWFSWDLTTREMDALVASGRLTRPVAGWVTAGS